MSGIKSVRPARGRALLATLLSSAAVAAIAVMSPQAALAQSTWQGTTSDYNTDGNWSPSGAPISAGQSAIFGGTGLASINVSSAVSPDSWTFNNNSQSYTITGSAVTFGTATGIVDNASGKAISIANNLAGSGGVAVNDTTGTLILTGANTYTGTTTIATGAGLQIGNGGTTGTLGTGAVTDNGILTFDRSDVPTVANNISGTGQVVVTGGATFSGNNSYGGATVVTYELRAGSSTAFSPNSAFTVNGNLDLDGFNNSIVSLSDNGLGSGSVINDGNNPATLTISGAASTSFSGAIQDGGGGSLGLTLSGTGTLTLTGTNAYSGATTIGSGATLKAGSPGALSTFSPFIVNGTLDMDGWGAEIASLSGSGIVTNSGASPATLLVDTAASPFSGIIQDGQSTLGLTMASFSTLTLTGANTYTGATIINGGATLQIGNGGDGSALASPSIVNNGALVVDSHSTITLSGAITGTGSFSDIASGAVILTGNNNYSGGTTISAGGIQIGAGGTTGSITGNVTDNAALSFNRGDNITFAGNISGTGFVQIAGGTVTLTGSNNYAGVTNVYSTLDISGAGNIGAGNVVLYNPGTLSVDSTANPVVANVITGTGALAVTGSGTLILTGANSYGTTTIASGATLQIDNGGTSGALGSGAVTDNGTLVIDRGDFISLSNAIGGSGALTLAAGSGGLSLSGNNSYSGTTTVPAGLELKAGSATALSPNSAFSMNGILDLNGFNNTIASLGDSGGGTSLVTNSGAGAAILTVSGAASTSFSGTIENGTSSIGLHVVGTGTLTLTGNNNGSYSGATTIDSGATLKAGSVTAFSTTSDFTVNGTLDLGGYSNGLGSLSGSGTVTNSGSAGAILTTGGDGASTTFSGTIRDGANQTALEVDGPGIQTLTGNNTFTGGTLICDCGTLQLGNGGASGSVAGAIIDDGTLIFDRSDIYAFNGQIAQGGGSPGNLVVAGTGTIVLSAVNNTYAGTTTIASGAILQVGDGGNDGSIGAGNIIDNGSLTFDSGLLFTLANTISGSGGLNAAGTGPITITTALTYTGATTIASGATLALSGTGSIASSSGVTDNGTFDISGAMASSVSIKSLSGSGNVNLGSNLLLITTGAGTFSGNMSGAGTVQFTGGTNILTGTISSNVGTYSGGVLQIGNGGTLGMVTGFIADESTVIFDHSDNIVVPASFAGTGNLVQAGTGTLTVNTSLGFGGTVIVSAGTLAFTGSGGLSIGPAGGIVDNATFDISGISGSNISIGSLTGSGNVVLGTKSLTLLGAGAFGGVLAGTGGVTLSASGTQIFTGNNTYSGMTTVALGDTLQIGSGGTSGSAGTGSITDSGALVLDRSDSVTFANTISGNGGLTQAGSGTVILTGANSYSGITTVNSGGTLQVGSGGTAGTLGSGNITDNGTLAFNRTDTVTVGNIISGTGGLTQAGTGSVILTGANTYSGITTISSGTLLVGSGGTLGTGNVTDNGALGFSRSDSVTVSNTISGTGSLIQSGTGTLILDGSSTFTGTAAVMNGILQIGDAAHPNASVGGSVSVFSGAALYGHGTVKGNVSVTSGGNLRPGGTIGTLTVNGNLSLPAGSTLTEEVSPSVGDRVTVGGTASLGGNLNVIADAGTYAAGTDYKIISASSVTGTFANVSGLNSSAFSGLNTNLQYSATGVDLILSNPPPVTPPITPPVTTFLFGSYGNTPNQIAAGNALTASSSTGALYTAMGALVGSSTASVPGALGQLAGDIRPSLRAAAIEDSRIIRDTVLDHLNHNGDTRTVWGAGFAGYGRLASDGNAANLHHDSAGFLAGVDMPVLPDVMLGADAGYSSNSARTPSRLSAASGNSGHVGAYASFHPGDLRLAIGGDYGFGTVTINRTVPQLGLTTTASQDQDTGQVFADLGYHIGLDEAALEPHLGIAHIVATGGAFAETGSVAALSGGEKSDSETYSLLGLRANLSDIALDDDLTLTPRFDLGWQHALARLTPYQTVSYVNAATSFLVLGTPLSQDAAALQAGFELRLAPSATLFVSYDGSFSNAVENHAFHGGLEWKF